MSKYKETAQKILDQAHRLDWEIEVKSDILIVSKRIGKDNYKEFAQADSEYSQIIGLLPQTKPGSVFGTDGSGVGALSALKHGWFIIKKTGGNQHVLNWITKLQGAQ